MYRHGDVLIAATERIPGSAKKRPRCVLAEGEITGHSHCIAEAGAAELFSLGNELYLSVVAEQATVVHEEHAPIHLPRGTYRVWRQREYSPAEIRAIRD
jgi:hypothetical protein